MRGRRRRADRPSLIVCDDVQNDSHMESARQRVISVEAAEARKAGEIVVDEGNAHERVISFLEQLKVI